MAIGTNDTIYKFGTQDQIDSTSGSVADAAMSAASDMSTWTNDDDAPLVSFILEAAWATNPTAASSVTLYAQLLNIEGTNDEPIPDSNWLLHNILSFTPDATTSRQYLAMGPVGLPTVESSQEYQFFLFNNSGQTMSASWNFFVQPVALGPAA